MSERLKAWEKLFQKAVLGVVNQGELSIEYQGKGVTICRYRGSHGRMCPVGHLIPSDKYTPEMEGLTVYDLAAHGMLPSELSEFQGELGLLQDAHDGRYIMTLPANEQISYFIKVCQEIADSHGIEMPELPID